MIWQMTVAILHYEDREPEYVTQKHAVQQKILIMRWFVLWSLYTHCLMASFPGEPGLVGCCLNSSSPFILELCILLGQA